MEVAVLFSQWSPLCWLRVLGTKRGRRNLGQVLLLPESPGAVGAALGGMGCMQESRREAQRCKISGVLSTVPQLSLTVLVPGRWWHVVRGNALCPSAVEADPAGEQTGIPLLWQVPSWAQLRLQNALPSTGGLTVSELLSVAEWGDFTPARIYGSQYKLQTRRGKDSSGNCSIDLALGFSEMSAWADCWRLSQVLGICVSNLIMHPRKSSCDLYRSLGFCIPLKNSLSLKLFFPFCKTWEGSWSSSLWRTMGRKSTAMSRLQMSQG